MFERIIERIRYADCVAEIILATTDSPEDDDLVDAAHAAGIPASRGPVDDIAERLGRAADETGADVLVRVWGDCPCVDPRLIDKAVRLMDEQGFDYVSTSIAGAGNSADGFMRSYPYGLDVELYRRGVLDEVRKVDDAFYREFPEDYVCSCRDRFRVGVLSNSADCSDIYVTVDYRADFDLVCAVFERLYDPQRPFSFEEVVTLLRNHPEIDLRSSPLARNIEYIEKKNLR